MDRRNRAAYGNHLAQIGRLAGQISDPGLGVNVLSFIGPDLDEIDNILFANIVPVDFGQTSGNGLLYTLDVGTGAATLVDANGVNFVDSLAWYDETQLVPIPANLALFSIGLAGLGRSRRKKV